MSQPAFAPLRGMRVVSLAVNLPGPLACARLQALGAEVARVEPPGGDPLASVAPGWYQQLTAGQRVERLDLKGEAGRAALDELLAAADLLVTSTRGAALARLGLGWEALHARHPSLCHLAILAEAGDEQRPGHDLTWIAAAGLACPPQLPLTLAADLAGGERAAAAALALLLGRARGQPASRAEVALSQVAVDLAAPLREGLTRPGGPLGGGSPLYGFYRTRDGWIALAALEPAFARRLEAELYVALERPALEAVFLTRTAEAWEAWAVARDLPLVAVATGTPGAGPATPGGR